MKRGILITILVIVLVIIFLALVGGYIYMQFTREPYIPENSFLKIHLFVMLTTPPVKIVSSGL